MYSFRYASFVALKLVGQITLSQAAPAGSELAGSALGNTGQAVPIPEETAPPLGLDAVIRRFCQH